MARRRVWIASLIVLALLFLVVLFWASIQLMHVTSSPTFCFNCHSGTEDGILAEVDSWRNSAHAEAGVMCLDCHAQPGFTEYMKTKMKGLKDALHSLVLSEEETRNLLELNRYDLVSQTICLHCHGEASSLEQPDEFSALLTDRLTDRVTGAEFRRNNKIPDIFAPSDAAGLIFNHGVHIERFNMGCSDCHLGVVHDRQNKTERKDSCLHCHEEHSRAPQIEQCRRCHLVQSAFFEGWGAIGLAGVANPMYVAGVDCTGCHAGILEGLYRPPQDLCLMCHDKGYQKLQEEWKSRTQQRMVLARTLFKEAGQLLDQRELEGEENEADWIVFSQAGRNLNLVRDDNTYGIHNFNYTFNQILPSVISDLQILIDNAKRTKRPPNRSKP